MPTLAAESQRWAAGFEAILLAKLFAGSDESVS
jgi:hypothetical protein